MSQAKLGLLLAGIGLILYSFLQFLGLLNIVSLILVVVGALLAWLGASKAWPAAKMTVMAGFALILVGMIVSVVSWVMIPSLFGTYDASYLNAYATFLLVGFIASLLTWIGVILVPLRITTGAGKALAIVGGVLGLVGSLAVFGLVYFAIAALASAAAGGGTLPSASEVLAIIGGIIIGGILGLVGGILAGVGYLVGRGKMPAAVG